LFELQYRDQLQRFLLEDLGVEGDVTSKYLGLGNREAAASIVARESGTVAGLLFVESLFQLLSKSCKVETRVEEGSEFDSGASLLLLTGPAHALLAGERTALNLLSRMFGIASKVRELVKILDGTGTKLLPTRKTLPGHRFFDKYAAEMGGAARHRYGLNDAIMIKDNHLVLGGPIDSVLHRTRASAGHMLTIEMECDTLDQLREILAADLSLSKSTPRSRGVDVVLLDNMTVQDMKQAVTLIRSHPRTILSEASGGIRAENLREVAATGVDFVSLGALTHSAMPVDLGLDFLPG
jgi:nicotinate-nucleotide pyrophosphorylase (carboxylating)